MRGVQSNISSTLGGAGTTAGQKAGANFASTFKKFIVSAGIGKIVADAFKGGAELQQNLGGTSAVFGDYAKKIQDQAQTAYKTMGSSASDYMATANKMGSLFQGSGLTQQRSLELTSQAMQRAADVASVMGIDTAVAMESIAGAAKGNFTMMDNLGVSMNATTLEAYALSKGLDFTWKSASNAEKAELAMQMFFERTAQYAGNFEAEASSTISGSFGALKSSAQNLMASLVLGNDIAPAWDGFKESISGVISAFGTLFEQSAALQQFTGWIKENEQTLTLLGIGISTLGVAVGAYAVAVNAATIAMKLHAVAVKIATAASAAWGAVTGFITSPITLVILGIGALIAVIYLLVKNWDTVKAAALKCWEGIKGAWNSVANWFKTKVIDPVVNSFNRMVTTIAAIGRSLVQGLWQGISGSYTWIKNKISGWVGNVMDFIKDLFGIHSPSTKMAWMGKMLDRGLAVGIMGNIGYIRGAITDMTKSTLRAFGNETPTLSARVSMDAAGAHSVSASSDMAMLIRHVDALGERISNMQIVLNNKKLVGGIATDMRQELGIQNAQIQRGVIK